MLFVGDDWAEDHHDIEIERARRRGVEARANELRTVLGAQELRQPAVLQSAYAAVVASEVAIIATQHTDRPARGGGGRPFWPAPGR